ncbi:unnamed protein product, partial [Mesorhabditis spiculigera]
MRTFVLLVALVAAVNAFTGLPSTYTTKQKNDACKDYCMNAGDPSPLTGFAFASNGWELCNCQVAQQSGSWLGSNCYNQCHNRCVNTLGQCSWNQALNTDYKGPCCSTSQTNTTVFNQCYKNTAPVGLCYST